MRLPRILQRDPEARALAALADAVAALPERHRPEEALQIVVDLARTETRCKYAALNVTDEHDRTQGFVTSGLTAAELKGLRVPPQGHGPLGSLRADGKPVRLVDVDKHQKAFGFPTKHPKMTTLLGVPLWASGVVRGSLYCSDRTDGKPFDDDDEKLVLMLARHASSVIEHEWY
ncbi:MAG: GAF domain-containing protein [Chloroflexi bacterium]|nr:MAG: GAF domain-containing protein [Chloroflexota bacterium]